MVIINYIAILFMRYLPKLLKAYLLEVRDEHPHSN